jgi:hypothetical protein
MSLFLIFGAVGLLMILLLWALRSPQNDSPVGGGPCLESIEESARQHATYFGLIRQAMSQEDFEFLAARGPVRLVHRAHKERQRIALLYLENLRADFQRLLRLARVIAVLSPEIAASHEFERLRLSIRFSWRYRIVLVGLYAGHLLMPQLSGLSQIVSELAFRMESAMQELGERATVAAELASTLNRSGLDTA